jgi:hypothetical protein
LVLGMPLTGVVALPGGALDVGLVQTLRR